MYTCACIRVCVGIFSHSNKHINVYICTSTGILISIHIWIRPRTHVFLVSVFGWTHQPTRKNTMRRLICVHIYIYIYIFIRMYISIHTSFAYTYTYTRLYIYMHINIHIYICVQCIQVTPIYWHVYIYIGHGNVAFQHAKCTEFCENFW